MVTAASEIDNKVDEIIKRIVTTGHPRKIILFGSYVTGDMKADSDLDILVIGDNSIDNPRDESVRIRRALKGLKIPIDILVVRENDYDALKDRPGLVYKEIARTGKVVYEHQGD